MSTLYTVVHRFGCECNFERETIAMTTLKERLRATLATFDGASDLLDGQGLGKDFLIHLYLILGTMRSYKQWEFELRDSYKQQMKSLNSEMYDSAQATIMLLKETTNYVVLCDKIKLPEFDFTRKTLEVTIEKDDIDEGFRLKLQTLLEENPTADTFQLAQIIGGEDRSIAFHVAPEELYRELFAHEYHHQARIRLKLQLLEKVKDMVRADQALWKERNNELSLFLDDRMVKMMESVRQITCELGEDGDIEMMEI